MRQPDANVRYAPERARLFAFDVIRYAKMAFDFEVEDTPARSPPMICVA